jgi:hypothetical protein
VHIGNRVLRGGARRHIAAARGELDALEQEGKSLVFIGTPEGAGRDRCAATCDRRSRRSMPSGAGHREGRDARRQRGPPVDAREVGIDDVHAKLKPEDKVRHVRELAQRHGHLLMVGDGVNDAPALAEATVGVAMGAAGTDVALETADVALMADDLRKLVEALALGRSAQRWSDRTDPATIVIAGIVTDDRGRVHAAAGGPGHELSSSWSSATGVLRFRRDRGDNARVVGLAVAAGRRGRTARRYRAGAALRD